MSKCKSCGADIIWVKNIDGRKMPIDAKPDPDGLLVLQGSTVLFARDAQGVRASTMRYTSHFATCPYGPTIKRR